MKEIEEFIKRQKIEKQTLQQFSEQLDVVLNNIPIMLERSKERTGNFDKIKEALVLLGVKRRKLYDLYNKRHNELVFHNDLKYGKIGEAIDQWFMTKKNKPMQQVEGIRAIDFITEEGLEDTKFSLQNENDFCVEVSSTGNAAHHWKYVEKGKNVFLRFINKEGCWRIKLTPQLKKQKCPTNVNTECSWTNKNNMQKVWEW